MPINDADWKFITPSANDVSAQVYEPPFDTTGPGFRGALVRRNNGQLAIVGWAVWGTTSPMGALFSLDIGSAAATGLGGLGATLGPRSAVAAPTLAIIPALAFDASGAGGVYYHHGHGIVALNPNGISISFVFSGEDATPTTPFTWAQGDWILFGNTIPAFDN